MTHKITRFQTTLEIISSESEKWFQELDQESDCNDQNNLIKDIPNRQRLTTLCAMVLSILQPITSDEIKKFLDEENQKRNMIMLPSNNNCNNDNNIIPTLGRYALNCLFQVPQNQNQEYNTSNVDPSTLFLNPFTKFINKHVVVISSKRDSQTLIDSGIFEIAEQIISIFVSAIAERPASSSLHEQREIIVLTGKWFNILADLSSDDAKVNSFLGNSQETFDAFFSSVGQTLAGLSNFALSGSDEELFGMCEPLLIHFCRFVGNACVTSNSNNNNNNDDTNNKVKARMLLMGTSSPTLGCLIQLIYAPCRDDDRVGRGDDDTGERFTRGRNILHWAYYVISCLCRGGGRRGGDDDQNHAHQVLAQCRLPEIIWYSFMKGVKLMLAKQETNIANTRSNNIDDDNNCQDVEFLLHGLEATANMIHHVEPARSSFVGNRSRGKTTDFSEIFTACAKAAGNDDEKKKMLLDAFGFFIDSMFDDDENDVDSGNKKLEFIKEFNVFGDQKK